MAVIFPRWTNSIPLAIGLAGPIVLGSVVFAIWYWGSPKFTDVGYAPTQPVPFSHQLHAGAMAMDCRYCHNAVERGAGSAVPPTATCMNCHSKVLTDSPRLAKVRESWETGKAVEWVRVHMLPDYAFFNHSVHLAAGVGCASCHGRIDQMAVVAQAEPLSMGWCLECHRNPAPHIRPPDVSVTDMEWEPDFSKVDAHPPSRTGGRPVVPPEHCSGCHR